MTPAVRLIIAVAIVGLLGRSARFAWHNRDVAVTVWRRVRPRHVLGSVVLLLAVIGVAVALITLVPVTGFGLGTLVGLTGNAVFAPVEQVATLEDPAGPRPAITALVTGTTVVFLTLLLALFPWLAYVEERTFRMGLERSGAAGQLWTALRFGLVHLVMLVPLAAALAIGVAGLWYGRVYLRTFRRLAADNLVSPAAARAEAVIASTVWHATFNSLIVVVLLMILFVEGSLL